MKQILQSSRGSSLKAGVFWRLVPEVTVCRSAFFSDLPQILSILNIWRGPTCPRFRPSWTSGIVQLAPDFVHREHLAWEETPYSQPSLVDPSPSQPGPWSSEVAVGPRRSPLVLGGRHLVLGGRHWSLEVAIGGPQVLKSALTDCCNCIRLISRT